jgi:hypothetical protein
MARLDAPEHGERAGKVAPVLPQVDARAPEDAVGAGKMEDVHHRGQGGEAGSGQGRRERSQSR